MRMWRMYKQWRFGYGQPADVLGTGAAIKDRLDSAADELNALNRDLARIGCRRKDSQRLEPAQHF